MTSKTPKDDETQIDEDIVAVSDEQLDDVHGGLRLAATSLSRTFPSTLSDTIYAGSIADTIYAGSVGDSIYGGTVDIDVINPKLFR